MTRAERFLEELTMRLLALGHTPRGWHRGRWGYTNHCNACGAHAACCVSDRRVREFPDDTCDERLAAVAPFNKERGQ